MVYTFYICNNEASANRFSSGNTFDIKEENLKNDKEAFEYALDLIDMIDMYDEDVDAEDLLYDQDTGEGNPVIYLIKRDEEKIFDLDSDYFEKMRLSTEDDLNEDINFLDDNNENINKIEFIYDDTNNKLVDALKFFDTVKDNNFNIIQVRNSSDNSLDMEITKNSDNTYNVVYQGSYRRWNGPGYYTKPAKRKRSYKRLNALFDFITTWYNVNYDKIKREADPYYEDPNESSHEVLTYNGLQLTPSGKRAKIRSAISDLTNMSDAKSVLKDFGIDVIKKDDRNYELVKDNEKYTLYILDNPNEVRKDLLKGAFKLLKINESLNSINSDKNTISKSILDCSSDAELYGEIKQIKYLDKDLYKEALKIFKEDGSVAYRAKKISDLLHNISESKNPFPQDKIKELELERKRIEDILDRKSDQGVDFSSESDELDRIDSEINKIKNNINESLEDVEPNLYARITNAIKSELDAIDIYNDLIVYAEMEGRSDIAKLMYDIGNEEKAHMGELQKALSEIDPNYQAEMQDGQQEADEFLSKQMRESLDKLLEYYHYEPEDVDLEFEDKQELIQD